MRLGIIGSGVVGSALERWVKKHTKTEVSVYDPPRGRDDNFSGVSAIFVCVPVPTTAARGQDLSIVDEVIDKFKCYQRPILVRSTVLPGTCDALEKKHGIPVIACPEFLTMRTADEDVDRHAIVAGVFGSGDKEIGIQRLELMMKIFPNKAIHCVKNVEAEMAKYAHNCFGALKVNYFNIVESACKKVGADYLRVLESAKCSHFIEETHTKVPGPDGLYGFGGPCLPKDLDAFIGFLKDRHIQGANTLMQVESDNYYFRQIMGTK